MIKYYIQKIVSKVIKIKNSPNVLFFRKKNNTNDLNQKFKNLGSDSYFQNPCYIKNSQYISIGKNFSALYNLRIEAWDAYMGDNFQPEIIIGDNVSINSDCHIGCIDRVIIGDNVLMASKIYISDHSHGEVNKEALLIPPVQRRLYSKGPVIIGNNVWIGENVAILPGVIIGANAIVGANAVVTRHVPANSVVGGNPARIIKQF